MAKRFKDYLIEYKTAKLEKLAQINEVSVDDETNEESTELSANDSEKSE